MYLSPPILYRSLLPSPQIPPVDVPLTLFSFVSSYHIVLLPYLGLFLSLTLSQFMSVFVSSSLHISFSVCLSCKKNCSVVLHAVLKQAESHSVSWIPQINLIWTAKSSFAEKV
jgi:hypothetical protein